MDQELLGRLPEFLARLGLDEAPMGLHYTRDRPEECFSPKPLQLPVREKEIRNELDWPSIFGGFSCAIGHIWRARRKRTAACFSAECFGCPGAAFWMGFNKPQAETIIRYVSSGTPGYMEGEHYCESPDELRRIFEYVDPRPAPEPYCVVKPVDRFTETESPELVLFFCRPESLGGLHQLATFVTNDPEAVQSPWSAGCGSLAAWPLRYLQKGENKAVLGGWDPSARKFFKTDELSFAVPFKMFSAMLKRYEESFIATHTWEKIHKRIERSKRVWGEEKASETAD